MYVAMNSQNASHRMEQFVVRAGLADKVKSLADFKGMKLMSAPGPANVNTAKGILAKVGLKDGDYTIDQLDMGQHVNAMKAGTFDGGYTLEPNATMMNQIGVAKTVEAGVIAKYVLGDPAGRSLRGRLRLLHRVHHQAAGRRQALRRGLGQGARLDQERSAGSAQVSAQEHADAGGPGRYGADARLRHGQGHDAQADRRLADSSPISATTSASCRRRSTSQISSAVLRRSITPAA